MSDAQTIAPWAAKTIELAESEGHWAGLAAWCIWAGQNWYDQDAAYSRDTIDDIGHYVLCSKLVDIADAEIEQLGTALKAARQCWEQLERLRSQGWCVVVKALPDNEPFVIEGSRSEYDAPCPDRRLWHGKWVCEVQWMRWGDTPETRYRCGTCMAGDTPEQAVAEACRILQEREAADLAEGGGE